MNFKTTYRLVDEENGCVYEQGEKLKLFLKSEEIIIGIYKSSNEISIILKREYNNLEIKFEEIEDIKYIR